MPTFLEFEKPIAELEGKIEELRHLANADDMNIAEEVAKLQGKADKLLRQTYGKLTAWQKTLVARHPDRPHFGDYVGALVEEWTPLAGDRNFADDHAIEGGLGRFRGRSVVVMGQEKGSDTTSRVQHNFGMARPEGYRKAQRLMDLADRFRLPVVTLVDTPGAYPGIDAEARGQAEAIARSIETCLQDSRSAHRRHHRRGRLGRRDRARRGQSRSHARAFRLFGDLPRGLRLHPLAQRRAGQGGRRGPEADRRDLLKLGIIDEIVVEPWAGPIATATGRSRAWAMPSNPPLPSSAARTARACAPSAARNSSPWARRG
jgi:Acetyl-CoA carboxylase alpha subunit